MSCTEFNERVLAACTGGDTVFAGPDCTRAVLLDVAAARRCIHEENDLNWPPFSRYLCRPPRDRSLDGVCAPAPGGGEAAAPAGTAAQAAPVADHWTMGPVGVAGTAATALAVGAMGQAARAKRKRPPDSFELLRSQSSRRSIDGRSVGAQGWGRATGSDAETSTKRDRQLQRDLENLQMKNDSLQQEIASTRQSWALLAQTPATVAAAQALEPVAVTDTAAIVHRANAVQLAGDYAALIANTVVAPPTIDEHGVASFQLPLQAGNIADRTTFGFRQQLKQDPPEQRRKLSNVEVRVTFTGPDPPKEIPGQDPSKGIPGQDPSKGILSRARGFASRRANQPEPQHTSSAPAQRRTSSALSRHPRAGEGRFSRSPPI